ncbi:hypothetical protein M407DRAFT_28265 [Tulasnella calospora MUT 4182]|uniref:Uncharacterized protein n=1 Tax=Tulasnella calospora MUT 4182 TaxID=1051891 RepID=A0A0C3Q1P2_9AGAM|nr:hypothetical protein M407DRAFT_28265 [Tulasnella calospora MUT 4182]
MDSKHSGQNQLEAKNTDASGRSFINMLADKNSSDVDGGPLGEAQRATSPPASTPALEAHHLQKERESWERLAITAEAKASGIEIALEYCAEFLQTAENTDKLRSEALTELATATRAYADEGRQDIKIAELLARVSQLEALSEEKTKPSEVENVGVARPVVSAPNASPDILSFPRSSPMDVPHDVFSQVRPVRVEPDRKRTKRDEQDLQDGPPPLLLLNAALR